MYFRIGTNIRKYFVYSLNTEPQTCLVWQDELHIAVHLNSLQVNFYCFGHEDL